VPFEKPAALSFSEITGMISYYKVKDLDLNGNIRGLLRYPVINILFGNHTIKNMNKTIV